MKSTLVYGNGGERWGTRGLEGCLQPRVGPLGWEVNGRR